MNREEARAYGEEWIKGINSLCDNDKRNLDDEDEEMYEFLKAAVSALQQDPCKDVVSRQALIEEFADMREGYPIMTDEQLTAEDVIKTILSMPTVEPKTGYWHLLDECSNSGYYCSECHKKVVKEGWSRTVKKIKFCPNCGCRMMEVENG